MSLTHVHNAQLVIEIVRNITRFAFDVRLRHTSYVFFALFSLLVLPHPLVLSFSKIENHNKQKKSEERHRLVFVFLFEFERATKIISCEKKIEKS